MRIQVEFNPDLALRKIGKRESEAMAVEECIPEDLEKGKTYPFLKSDQRNYWIHGAIPLIETKGNEILSRPKASVKILEATHFLRDGKIYTKGLYEVLEVFSDKEIYFECFDPIGKRKDF